MAALARPAAPSPLPDNSDVEPRLDRLLRLLDAEPTDPVGVAGPEALELMCALARRGFDRVEAARRRTCGVADHACELLILSGPDAETIAANLEAVAGMLRPGGRLAVMTHGLAGAAERRSLSRHLAERGWRRPEDGVDGGVLIATKPA